jgi:hypothetical protein
MVIPTIPPESVLELALQSLSRDSVTLFKQLEIPVDGDHTSRSGRALLTKQGHRAPNDEEEGREDCIDDAAPDRGNGSDRFADLSCPARYGTIL